MNLEPLAHILLLEAKKTLDALRKDRLVRLTGKYVITCKKDGKTLYLQDQRISNKGYWTQFKANARAFSLKETAERVMNTLRYNNPKITRI